MFHAGNRGCGIGGGGACDVSSCKYGVVIIISGRRPERHNYHEIGEMARNHGISCEIA